MLAQLVIIGTTSVHNVLQSATVVFAECLPIGSVQVSVVKQSTPEEFNLMLANKLQ